MVGTCVVTVKVFDLHHMFQNTQNKMLEKRCFNFSVFTRNA